MLSEKKLKVLVVDDETVAREGLVRMLSARSEVVSVRSCSNGIEAINAINETRFDLLLLDIQMPLVDGFDVLRSVKQDNIPYVVFITAYEQYAVKAFEFHAVDYVLKPFSDRRLYEVIKRVKRLIHDQEHIKRLNKLLNEKLPDSKSVEYIETPLKEKMVFKENGIIIFLDINNIIWIEAYDYYVKIHVKGKIHLVRTSLKKLEKSLDPDRFIRIHKSSIVSSIMIANIDTKAGDWTLKLLTGETLKVGRTYKDGLKDSLKI